MKKWNIIVGSLICLVIVLIAIQLVLVKNPRESLDWEKISGEIRSSLSKTEAKGKEATQEENQIPFEKVKVTEHIVKKGESLWSIARKYGIDIPTIVGANNLRDLRVIQLGQRLNIPTKKGIFYTVQYGQSLWEIARNFGLEVEEIARENKIEDSTFIRFGKTLFLPEAKPWGESGRFLWPVRGRLSSGYGFRKHPMGGGRFFHHGIDIAAPRGRSVMASQGGRVISAGWNGNYGKIILLKHRKGYSTAYAHLSKILVKKGEYVTKGQVIGRLGNTGRSTGPHLHFEIRKNRRSQNPLKFLY
jgi:murein DD-endopeptidase MepM/ murein hydrolase activator NlpD